MVEIRHSAVMAGGDIAVDRHHVHFFGSSGLVAMPFDGHGHDVVAVVHDSKVLQKWIGTCAVARVANVGSS